MIVILFSPIPRFELGLKAVLNYREKQAKERVFVSLEGNQYLQWQVISMPLQMKDFDSIPVTIRND